MRGKYPDKIVRTLELLHRLQQQSQRLLAERSQGQMLLLQIVEFLLPFRLPRAGRRRVQHRRLQQIRIVPRMKDDQI